MAFTYICSPAVYSHAWVGSQITHAVTSVAVATPKQRSSLMLVSDPCSSCPSSQVSAKMLEFARKQRMNTDVRRNIFCTVMSSEDFLDAFEKLLK